MKYFNQVRAFTFAFTISVLGQFSLVLAQEVEKKDMPKDLEIGGVVTLDFEESSSSDFEPEMNLGEIRFLANLGIHRDLKASIEIINTSKELDHLGIDQALVEWTLPKFPFGMVFGQQYYPVGLLNNRIISDPLILDPVETSGPGIYLSSQPSDVIAFGAGVSRQNIEVDTLEEQKLLYMLNVDLFPKSFIHSRISGFWCEEHGSLVDLSGELQKGPLTLDFEGFYSWDKDGNDQQLGMLVGGAWGLLPDLLSVVSRVDYLSPDAGDTWQWRLGGGAVFELPHGLFFAMEYGYQELEIGNTDHEIKVQIGLESSLKMAGWQRNTLISNPGTL